MATTQFDEGLANVGPSFAPFVQVKTFDMTHFRFGDHRCWAGRRLARGSAAAMLSAALLTAAQPAVACEFAEVKAAIDGAIEKDAKDFKKQFDEGSDPFTIVEKLVTAEVSKKIDVCRFQAAEYLTKRGFPPAH